MRLFKTREEREEQKRERELQEAGRKRSESEKRLREVEAREALKRTELQEYQRALEFILTISAGDYVQSVGRTLEQYDFRAVGAPGYTDYLGQNSTHRDSLLVRLLKQGEKVGAEKIVDVKVSCGEYSGYAYALGTALIPKTKNN
jgi:hypothetical protein